MTKECKECRRLFCGPSMTSTIALFQCQLLKLGDYRVQMRAGDREQLFDLRIRTGRATVKHYQTVCTRTHVYTHHRYTSLRLLYTSLSLGEPLFFLKCPNAVTCTYAIRNKKTWAAWFFFSFFSPSLERKFGPDSSVDDVSFRMTSYSTLIQWADPHGRDSPLTQKNSERKNYLLSRTG